IPPSQGDAKLAALANTAWLARLGLALLLVTLLAAAAPGRWRRGVLVVAGWVLLRAPVGPRLLFSPATFYRPVVGVFGTSAGSLLVAGVVVLIAAGGLWRRGVKRTWWGMAAATFLILAAPYVVRHFGRGIAPPASGVCRSPPAMRSGWVTRATPSRSRCSSVSAST